MKVDFEISKDQSQKALANGQPLGPAPYNSLSHSETPKKSIWLMGFVIAFIGSFYIYRTYKGMETTPELGGLLFWAAIAPIEYMFVRRVTYRAIWLWVSRSYPLVGRIHPAARGELPIGKYLVVLIFPWIASIATFGAVIITGLAKWPEIGLFAMLFLIVALEDVWALFHCLRADRNSWIMETNSGLETLRPVG